MTEWLNWTDGISEPMLLVKLPAALIHHRSWGKDFESLSENTRDIWDLPKVEGEISKMKNTAIINFLLKLLNSSIIMSVLPFHLNSYLKNHLPLKTKEDVPDSGWGLQKGERNPHGDGKASICLVNKCLLGHARQWATKWTLISRSCWVFPTTLSL